VAATPHASRFGDYYLTVSVGVATLRRGEPWGNLIEAAERACLKAKQGGRDTVVSR
jgi:PleD family two-component response regulator